MDSKEEVRISPKDIKKEATHANICRENDLICKRQNNTIKANISVKHHIYSSREEGTPILFYL
ncbi:hypothetical protein [Spirochaeta cellobiosiphila]|uniref:hypothetical protein n=1 Tax=Spirochaeta cellobiosiphila TaxID=504483 RepID=UPI0004921BE0|nr:hypothetical protein [Spirochaeta cellobiosiphila]